MHNFFCYSVLSSLKCYHLVNNNDDDDDDDDDNNNNNNDDDDDDEHISRASFHVTHVQLC